MKITVLGAGALGSLMGGILSKAHDVTLVGRQAHIDAIEREGLSIGGPEEMICYPRAATEIGGGKPDIILLTVKAYDTNASVPLIASVAGPRTIVVSLQNGLENHFTLANDLNRVVTGLTSWGATFLAPGKVLLSGRGEIVLGTIQGGIKGESEDAGIVKEALAIAGIDSRISDNIEREVWSKAVVNACINPLTALVRRENGCLLDAGMHGVARRVCSEAVTVANACGAELDEEEAFEKVISVARFTSSNRSSMLQDVERGRRTEIDDITGSIVRRGRERGVDVTLNGVLWSLVRSASTR
jgi:2-dehydropantoate 2-reductase